MWPVKPFCPLFASATSACTTSDGALLMYAMPSARPLPMKQALQFDEPDTDAPGLSVAAVHVAVARFDPDERYALTMWFEPPAESAVDVSVKSHHTPAFAA